MINKDFWKLKTGDWIYDEMRNRLMQVVKRTVENEVIGMIISKNTTTDILNGRKYVQLTLKDPKGNTFYYDSTRPDIMKYLKKIHPNYYPNCGAKMHDEEKKRNV